MNTISFPGLGIAAFDLSRTAITLGPISIQWYAVVICIGIIVAFFVCDRLTGYFGIKEDDFLDIILWTVPLGFIGARVGYIIGDLSSFPDFYSMIAIWNGGIAIYGGIIAAIITMFVVCRIKKISYGSVLDLAAIAFLIGQSIGRWGNFFNAEVYGVTTDLPWRMGILQNGEWGYYHPLFLYESLWNVVGLVLVLSFLENRKFRGEVFLWYSAWYGLGRAAMELMRDEEFQLHVFGIPINFVVATVAVVASLALLVYFRFFKRENHIDVEKSLSFKELIAQRREQKDQMERENYQQQFSVDMTDDVQASLTDEEYIMKKTMESIENQEEPNEDH